MPPNTSTLQLAVDYLVPLKEYAFNGSITRNLSANTLAALAAKREQVHEVPVTAANALRPLHCVAQQYAWGRIGSNSMVGRMKAAQDDDFCIDEDTPYAELWLGTHPNGMSQVTIPGDSRTSAPEGVADVQLSLLDYVQSNPTLHLGHTNNNNAQHTPCEHDLTFLFKVLSIHKTLSIQAHPDKTLAEMLHADRPKVYKDANHKPEMAVALSDDFEAMCGFRPIEEIAHNLQQYPELAALVGEEASAEVIRLVMDCSSSSSPATTTTTTTTTRAVLQRMFKGYMDAPSDAVQEQLERLLTRLHTFMELDETQRLIVKLSLQFPGDSGILAPLLLNHVKCAKGQAFYIGANEPHAYIFGEILECMACSDNVVRAGLTPKLKDVETLVNMLTYKSAYPQIMTCGMEVDACTTRYAPPVSDFMMDIISVGPNETYEINSVQSPSVLLTLEGSATLSQKNVCKLQASFGSALFMSANTRAQVQAGSCGVKMARAMTNVHHDDFLLENLFEN